MMMIRMMAVVVREEIITIKRQFETTSMITKASKNVNEIRTSPEQDIMFVGFFFFNIRKSYKN